MGDDNGGFMVRAMRLFFVVGVLLGLAVNRYDIYVYQMEIQKLQQRQVDLQYQIIDINRSHAIHLEESIKMGERILKLLEEVKVDYETYNRQRAEDILRYGPR